MNEIKLTAENFETEVLKADKPVLVDFFANWCGPCSMLAPIIEEIAEEYDGKVKVGKINVDEETELSAKYGISGIPALFLFENGEVKRTCVGAVPKQTIVDMLG